MTRPADQDSLPAIRAQLKGSLDFLVGMLVFGATVFALLLNLCYLAVERDVEILRAYLVITHAQDVQPEQIGQAIDVLSRNLRSDVRWGGRPVLCEDDYALIQLQPTLPEPHRKAAAELLARKTGEDSGWKGLFLRDLPLARSPLFMPDLELSLLYYTWVIEIAMLVFLSQSLRKSHVRRFLYDWFRRPGCFLPLVTLLVMVPLWRGVCLVHEREVGWAVGLVTLAGAVLLAALLFVPARARMTEETMNELGFYILISSLFVQLLAMMGDPDLVYPLFASPEIQAVRYVTWFILVCLPLSILEKWYRGRGGVRVVSEGEDLEELEVS